MHIIGIMLYVLTGILFTLWVNTIYEEEYIDALSTSDNLVCVIGFPVVLIMIIYWWCEDLYSLYHT